MGIRIEEINVKNLGPLVEKKFSLSSINVIYGKNESGKTHLVEFIIKSLFKNSNYPGIRNITANGRIAIDGLGDKLEYFSPNSKKKLDEFLRQENDSLPTNISRLLVVRAGELSMVDNRQDGIDRSVLEEYLSDTSLINSIRGKISPTVQKSSVGSGLIQGNRQGQIKEYHELKDQQNKLDELIATVNSEYTLGYRTSLQIKLNEARENLEIQKQAKFHLAYKLDKKIQEIDQELSNFSEEQVQQTIRYLDEYKSKTNSIEIINNNLQKNKENSAELSWLKTAADDYQTLMIGTSKIVKPWLLYFAGFFFVLSGILILIRQPYLTLLMLVIGVGLGYLYIHNLQKSATNAIQASEAERIREEFKQKFGRELTDLATLRMVFNQQNEASINSNLLENQLKDLQSAIEIFEEQIFDTFWKMTGEKINKDSWSEVIHQVGQKIKDLKGQLEDNRVRFAGLQVSKDEFRAESSSQEFDHIQLIRIGNIVNDLTSELTQEDQKLNSLRQRLAQETHLDISTSWEDLIDKLQDKRNQCNEKYRDISAKVISSYLVNSVLEEIYKEEEKRIQDGLHSQVVNNYLKQMTTHYERIEFEDGRLKVADSFSEYNFGELSTATQEQVLLAIRMGISSHCFIDQSMFLVLDDAFQHSDWNRRENLVDSVLKIAQLGWQIIYMTMDDNIRDLLISKAQIFFPNETKLFEL